MTDKRFAMLVGQLLRSYDKKTYDREFGNLDRAQAEIFAAFGDEEKTDRIVRLLESTMIKSPVSDGQQHTNEAVQYAINGMKERLSHVTDE